MIFALYRDRIGGAPLWQEVQNVAIDGSGHYAAFLSARSTKGLPVELFSNGDARWLGVQSDGQAEQARVLLVSVPYALKASDAETLGGLPASAFLRANSAVAVQAASYINTAAVNSAVGGNVTLATAANGVIAGVLPVFTNTNGDLGSSLLFQSGNFFGIGTAAPAAALNLVGTNPTIRIDNYSANTGDSPNLNFLTARGTALSPSATLNADNLGQFAAAGYNGSDFPGSKVRVAFVATENWTPNANGTAVSFETTANSTTARTERLRIDNTGYVGIGTNKPTSLLTVAGPIQSTTGGFVFPDGSSQMTAAPKGLSGDASNGLAITGILSVGPTLLNPVSGISTNKVSISASPSAPTDAATKGYTDTVGFADKQDSFLWQLSDVRLRTIWSSLLTPLPIHTAYGPGTTANLTDEVVHPSLIYEPMGWNGYRYWLAYTPYPGGNNAYENPSIAVSDDGRTWSTPSGLINPIVGKPSVGYNSDTHIILSPDKSKMYMMFRERGPGGGGYNNLKLLESRDGILWTMPVTIARGLVGTQDYACPSFWWDGSRWVVITHNLDVAGYPVQRMVTSGSDIYAGWSSPSPVTMVHPTAGTWWHSYFTPLADGRILGIVQDGASGGGSLYWAMSYDNGVTFTPKAADNSQTHYYRSSIAINSTADPSQLTAILGRTRYSTWGYYFFGSFADMQQQVAGTEAANRRAALFYSVRNSIAGNYLAADDFNRADSATSLGATIDGKTYTQEYGARNVIGVSGNQAYNATSSNCRAVIDLGVGHSDFIYELRFAALGGQGWMVFRSQDSNNYWRVGNQGAGAFWLQKIVASSIGNVNAFINNVVAGDTLRVETQGSLISIYKNELLVYRIVDGTYLKATKIGISASGSPSRFDDLLVWTAFDNKGIMNASTYKTAAPPSGAIVGTTDPQTLTNKTVDGVSPATMVFVDPTSSIQGQLTANAKAITTKAAINANTTGTAGGLSGSPEITVASATVGIGRAKLTTSSANDVILNDGAGNQAFRSVLANAWVDSVATQFFEVGPAAKNVIFAGIGGSAYTRSGFSTTVLQLGSGAFRSFAAPVAGDQTEILNAAGAIVAAQTTTGELSVPAIAGTIEATIAAGVAAGTNPTIACAASHVCDQLSGTITLTLGTNPTTGALLTLTTGARTNLPNCNFTVNLTAAQYTAATSILPAYTTTVTTLNSGAVLTESTSYTVTYSCGGK